MECWNDGVLEWSSAAARHSTIPTFQYSIIPLLHHSIIPSFHHSLISLLLPSPNPSTARGRPARAGHRGARAAAVPAFGRGGRRGSRPNAPAPLPSPALCPPARPSRRVETWPRTLSALCKASVRSFTPFDVDEAVEAGELEARVGLIDHRPGRRVAAAPMAGVGRMGGAHFVERAARRNGRRRFHRQLAARLGFFAPFQFLRQHLRKLARAAPHHPAPHR